MGSDLVWGEAQCAHEDFQRYRGSVERTIAATVERAEKAEAEVTRLREVLRQMVGDLSEIVALSLAVNRLETRWSSDEGDSSMLAFRLSSVRDEHHAAVDKLRAKYPQWEHGEVPWRNPG